MEVLEKLRGSAKTISQGDFILLLDKLTAAEVRNDFAAIGISLSPERKFDVQSAYWAVVKAQSTAETEASKAANIELALPDESSLISLLSNTKPIGGNPDLTTPEAALILEFAFDCLEHLELTFLGHGRMSDGEVAFRHQLQTAKRVFEEMKGLAIVSDEVGLGKTNIAGLILEELFAHNPEASALILVPANLRTQWAEKELPKYFRRVVTTEAHDLAVIDQAPVLLLSLDQAKGGGGRSALSTVLRRRTWDLLIIDEAHECRNAERLRFRFVYSLKAKRRVFLTATPIHNSAYDIFNLVTLLKPGALGQRRFFADTYMDGERILKDNDALQQTIMPMMTRTLRRDTGGIPFAKRDLRTIEIKAFKAGESVLYDELLSVLQGIYHRHMGAAAAIGSASGQVRHVSQFVLIAMLVLREMASHPLSALETLKTALRKRVQSFADITRDDSDLIRLDDFIQRYARQSWDPAQHAKSERLLSESKRLFASGKKFVIYLNYLKTLKVIGELLGKQHPDAAIVSYEGKFDRDRKKEAIERFEREPKACLVSTDSGGQGLNLQFADCIVNYDFPWNPMRIEQRIGRVDRVKQKSGKIEILNFRTEGTVEEYVQIVLTLKLKECRSVLGEFTSPLQIEKAYEDKLTMGIGRALMEARDAKDMRKRMKQLGEDDLRRYVGDYAQYEKEAPPEWTWRPRD
jgi:SNF2 family DNA or RNA helicase